MNKQGCRSCDATVSIDVNFIHTYVSIHPYISIHTYPSIPIHPYLSIHTYPYLSISKISVPLSGLFCPTACLPTLAFAFAFTFTFTFTYVDCLLCANAGYIQREQNDDTSPRFSSKTIYLISKRPEAEPNRVIRAAAFLSPGFGC